MNNSFGVSPHLLVRAPYNPISTEALASSAKGLAFSSTLWARLFPSPGLGLYRRGYGGGGVGHRPAPEQVPRIALDIGTNGEIVLSDGRRMVACSCAAGPAFEVPISSAACAAAAGP